MSIKPITRTDIYGYILLLTAFGIGIYYAYTDPAYFNEQYAQEDGPIEYATTFMLLCISLLCFARFISLYKHKKIGWKIGVLGFALLFLFGAGEEVSWGQRIFDIESSDYFKEFNLQGETNIHNIIVGDIKINQLIFSQILTGVLIIYLLVLPLLYRAKNSIQKLTTTFAIPIPRWHHTLAFVATTLFVLLIPADRKWELYEFAFGLIFFLIFLRPLNLSVFSKGMA